MYCKNCGNKMDETAKFCSSCGVSLNGDESDEIVLTVKPVFIGWATIVTLVPLTIFLSIWGAGFLGGFTFLGINGLTGNLDSPIVTWQPFAFFGVLFLFGLPVVSYFWRKFTYQYTIYKFYRTKIEYTEIFLTKELKSVSYKRILEVNLRKGIIQQSYSLGTIILSTAATGADSGTGKSGIIIANIENSDTVYAKVKHLIENCQ